MVKYVCKSIGLTLNKKGDVCMKIIFTIAAFIVWSGMICFPFYKGMAVIVDTVKDIVREWPKYTKSYRLKYVIEELGWIFFGLFLVSIAVMLALIPFVY